MMHVLITVPILRFVILFLLFLGAERICMHMCGYFRIGCFALIGAAYSLVCLLPGFEFMGKVFVNYFVLSLLALLCFGIRGYGAATFICLNLVLDALVQPKLTLTSFVLFVAGAAVLLIVLFKRGKNLLLPVTLYHKNKTVSFYALYDTGNHLKDPITGASVLVVSPRIAMDLAGVTLAQIKEPLQTMEKLPGFRLIPYKTVGCGCGFMLGLQVKEVRLGKKKYSGIIAFAPEELEGDGRYQALAGGIL